MTGTIINAAAILVAGSIGLIFRRGIPHNISRTMTEGLGLLIIAIGIQFALKADNLALVGLCLALGAVWGKGSSGRLSWNPSDASWKKALAVKTVSS